MLGAALQRLLFVATLHVLKQVVDEVQPEKHKQRRHGDRQLREVEGQEEEEETDRLSLSRLRTSSLKVSRFFCSIPLTSYTTCSTSRGQQTAADFHSYRRRRIPEDPSDPAHLAGVMFDSEGVHGHARLHVERVLLQTEAAGA